MSTLVVKLVGIFVKQLSKPLANQLSKAVIANEALRKSTVTTARVRLLSDSVAALRMLVSSCGAGFVR